MERFTCFTWSDSIQFLECSSEIAFTSALVSLLNWTGFLFNNNSIIHRSSLLCVDIISIVPRKDSLLTVCVRIFAKFVTDLHTDWYRLYFLYLRHVASQARHLDMLETATACTSCIIFLVGCFGILLTLNTVRSFFVGVTVLYFLDSCTSVVCLAPCYCLMLSNSFCLSSHCYVLIEI